MLKRDREGKPFTFYHYMIDLKGGPCIYKRISGCGSGTEYMAVTPWGDLYPCHQFVGDEKFKLGDMWNGVDNTEIQNEFRIVQRLCARGLRGLLGKALLLGRLCGERISRDRFGIAAYINTAVTCSAKEWNVRLPLPLRGNWRACNEYPDMRLCTKII